MSCANPTTAPALGGLEQDHHQPGGSVPWGQLERERRCECGRLGDVAVEGRADGQASTPRPRAGRESDFVAANRQSMASMPAAPVG